MDVKSFVFKAVATEEQIARCAAVASEIWHESYAALLAPEQIDYMVETLQSAPVIARHIQAQHYEYYLVESGGQDTGYVALQPENGRLLLSKCYLKAQARGTGNTDQLFAFVEQRARALGCGVIWLTVNKHNARAIAAYKKRGYATVGQQVVDIGGGFVMDDYVMEKNIL